MVLVVFCTLCPDMDMLIFVISYHVSRMSNRQLPSYPKQFNAYPTLLLTEQTGVGLGTKYRYLSVASETKGNLFTAETQSHKMLIFIDSSRH